MRDISYIGQTNFTTGIYKESKVFGLKREDRPRHVYVVGKSGMGKSCLLEQLIRFDVACGHGVAVIDPHGDLANNVLRFIPKDRIDDVIVVDPSDVEHPIAFNPFAQVPPEFRQLVAQGLVEIFRKQFTSTWTPRIEHLFRFACLAMLEYPEGTLHGLLQILIDSHFRQEVLRHITDEAIQRFFSIEFASFSQKYDQEAIVPLTNRLGQFFADPLMRNIFSHAENKIDFSRLMNEQKILIVKISKGNLGEENSALFGSFFLTKIEQAAMARGRMPQADRVPFYLYVDEFQNVATRSFIALFSESRKYAMNITVANQYLDQISAELQHAIFGNIGTFIIFRLGGADAQLIAAEFQPLLKPHDLMNLGSRDFYIKMSIGGKTVQPFSAKTLTLEALSEDSLYDAIMASSRKKYCRTGGRRGVAAHAPSAPAPSAGTDALPPPL